MDKVEITQKIPIAFIMDDKLSHDKVGVLTEKVKILRQSFPLQVIKPFETSENELIQRIENKEFQLILAPLHKYKEWSRLEGAFGINRTSGPTFAGYFCETVPFYQLPEPRGYQRRIIIDFAHLESEEILLLIRSLLIETARSGISSLLEPNSLIYCENWYGGQGQGSRIDHVLGIPEIGQTSWIKRSSAIRILLSAFWSLIYEEGPGKSEGSFGVSPEKTPKAYFQVTADNQCLVLRLCYQALPHCTPKDAIQKFWPDSSNPTQASQLLLKFSDFARIHTFAESPDIEIVAGLFHSAPAEKHPDNARTLWIEPLSRKLLTEAPYEAPGPNAPSLRTLPTVSRSQPKLRLIESNSDLSQNQAMQAASAKIKELSDTIRELRSGGVGTAPPLAPPDVEALLEAFQQRYFEARYQIRQFELQIEDMKTKGASSEEIHTLRLKMEALANREKAWIKKLTLTLETYKDSNRKR